MAEADGSPGTCPRPGRFVIAAVHVRICSASAELEKLDSSLLPMSVSKQGRFTSSSM